MREKQPDRVPPAIVQRLAYTMSGYTMNVGDNLGACIPMSYALMKAIRGVGIPAGIAEAKVVLTANGDIRRGETQANPKTGFLGHALVYLPTKHWLIDATLHTQFSNVIRLANPSGDPVYLDFDHNKHTVADVKLERGTAKYDPIRLTGNTWNKSRMPWEQLDRLGASLALEARSSA